MEVILVPRQIRSPLARALTFSSAGEQCHCPLMLVWQLPVSMRVWRAAILIHKSAS
jgi:hypothetical protein